MERLNIKAALAKALNKTEEQVTNLARLAIFHRDHPELNVRMHSFHTQIGGSSAHFMCDLRPEYVASYYTPHGACRTAGCVVGWAPAAGIMPQGTEEERQWEEFMLGRFGVYIFDKDYELMFDINWPDSGLAGAERIAWYLEGRDTNPLNYKSQSRDWSPNWELIEQLSN